MKFSRSFLGAAFVCFLSSPLAFAADPVQFDGPITDIDGRTIDQYTGPGTKDVVLRRRPWTPTDTDLTLSNIRIHDVLNQKGIDIGQTGTPTGSQTFNNITIQHYENYNDTRTVGGLHIDGLRISGAGDFSTHPTNVTLQDVSVHDGSTLPINIQDGWFGTILLDHVQVYNNQLNQFQIATIHSGHWDHLIVENSPGLQIAVMGKPGSVGDVQIINSPGANVDVNTNYSGTYNGLLGNPNDALFSAPSGITSADSFGSISTVPEPASVGSLALIGLLGLRRRGRKPKA